MALPSVGHRMRNICGQKLVKRLGSVHRALIGVQDHPVFRMLLFEREQVFSYKGAPSIIESNVNAILARLISYECGWHSISFLGMPQCPPKELG